MGSLNAMARAFAFRGFARPIAPSSRPGGYTANGSFHGELLSVHKTKPVSLTHQRRKGAEEVTFKFSAPLREIYFRGSRDEVRAEVYANNS